MIGLFTGILLFGAAGTTLAAFVVAQRRLVARLASCFRALPRAQQTLLVFAVGALVAWAGTKPEGKGEIIELSNNRSFCEKPSKHANFYPTSSSTSAVKCRKGGAARYAEGMRNRVIMAIRESARSWEICLCEVARS